MARAEVPLSFVEIARIAPRGSYSKFWLPSSTTLEVEIQACKIRINKSASNKCRWLESGDKFAVHAPVEAVPSVIPEGRLTFLAVAKMHANADCNFLHHAPE